jgi:hypothetical protein
METKKDLIYLSGKVDRLETHDRLLQFTKESNQSLDISECCQDLINKRPFGEHAFYIFAHSRTMEDGFNQVLIWQPRLTKPKAQTNSMLFKAYPGSDNIKVIWMIPKQELWAQYTKDKMTSNPTVVQSIDDYLNRREELEESEPDDLSDDQIYAIYAHIAASSVKSKPYVKI